MIILRAHYVLPVISEAIPDGAVAIDGNEIIDCGSFLTIQRKNPSVEVMDWGQSVILPGLINAHTHLELSDLRQKIHFNGSFIDWVRDLTIARYESRYDLRETISRACRESLAGGVTTVGDIAFEHRAWQSLKKEPIRKVCFAEVFGLGSDLATSQRYLKSCIDQTQTDSRLRLGISPHAPYSAGSALYSLAGRLAGEHNLPLTTHLAENTEEMEFTALGTGPWREFVQKIGKWDDSFVCPGTSPVDYFLHLDLHAQPFLLAHVNYCSDAELHNLSRTAHSVVYCPRSHWYFRHPPHSFQKMLALGINVCLGTDSLASNTTLSLLDEMRFVHSHYPDCPAETILKMATFNGAQALNWADRIGSIEPGKQADLIVIPLENCPSEPCIDLLRSSRQPIMTMIGSEIVYREGS
jgi:cytosine/adenosine deaminase-related metal-dependent hydrolase